MTDAGSSRAIGDNGGSGEEPPAAGAGGAQGEAGATLWSDGSGDAHLGGQGVESDGFTRNGKSGKVVDGTALSSNG